MIKKYENNLESNNHNPDISEKERHEKFDELVIKMKNANQMIEKLRNEKVKARSSLEHLPNVHIIQLDGDDEQFGLNEVQIKHLGLNMAYVDDFDDLKGILSDLGYKEIEHSFSDHWYKFSLMAKMYPDDEENDWFNEGI